LINTEKGQQGFRSGSLNYTTIFLKPNLYISIYFEPPFFSNLGLPYLSNILKFISIGMVAMVGNGIRGGGECFFLFVFGKFFQSTRGLGLTM